MAPSRARLSSVLSPRRKALPSDLKQSANVSCGNKAETSREAAQVVCLFAVQSQWVPVSSLPQKEMLHLPDFGDNCRDAVISTVGPEVKKPKQGAYLFLCLVGRNSI